MLSKIGEISYGNPIDLINDPIAPVVVAKVHVGGEYLQCDNQLPTLRRAPFVASLKKVNRGGSTQSFPQRFIRFIFRGQTARRHRSGIRGAIETLTHHEAIAIQCFAGLEGHIEGMPVAN